MNYTDILLGSILEESAKTDFINKFGQDTFNNFEKAKQRLVNNGLSVDYGQYLKKDKQEVDDLLLSLYNKKDNKGRDIDAEKRRVLQNKQREVRGKYKFYGEHNGYLVYQPLDYVSSMDLGINTGWCTTGRFGHAGHPEFTPSEEDAKEHFDSYINKGIKLYYFLNPQTFYGEYAIAYYPKVLEPNKAVYDKPNHKVIILKSTRMEVFNSNDDNIWVEPTILDIAKDVLNLNTNIVFEDADRQIDENGFEIADGILVKYWEQAAKVVIPNTVTRIKDAAFYGSALTSIEIPDSVISIEQNAFFRCKNLTSIKIPGSVISIGDWAFYGCAKLAAVILGNGVQYIGGCTFQNCTGLTSVTIPDTVTSIGDYAFENCTSLMSVTIPESVTIISTGAFFKCESLQNIVLPNSLVALETAVFMQCTNLQSITIPDSVTIIEERAFYFCRNLTKVTIGKGVKCIDGLAFMNCKNLAEVIILSDNVTRIDSDAFKNTNLNFIVKTNCEYVTKFCNKKHINCVSLTNESYIRSSYSDSLIEEYITRKDISEQVKKAVELLKPYKKEMIPYWCKDPTYGKKLNTIPDNIVAIHEDWGAILIPDIDNHIYIGGSHLSLYLECWEPIMFNHFDVFAQIFDLAETSNEYKQIKKYIADNELKQAWEVFSEYLHETLDDTLYDYYNEIYCWAPLHLFNTVYLRCECNYLYFVDRCGTINEYQIDQTERFLDLTFYSYPFTTGRGLEINGKHFSSTDGYTVDDVMKEFYK